MEVLNECICNSYDGRGFSCCNITCPIHEPKGKCPDCGTAVYEGKRCFQCDLKWADENRPKSCKQMENAYIYSIKTFQALEAWMRIEDKNPNTSEDEIKAAVKTLREIWEHKIIPWHIAEDNHHNWHEPE